MRWVLKRINAKRKKVKNLAAALTRMTAVILILTLLPVSMEVSAIEGQEMSGEEAEPASEAVPEEREALREKEEETKPASRETSKETEALKETKPASKMDSEETEALRETEKETKPASKTDPEETEALKETEKETLAKEETTSASELSPKETESFKEEKKEGSAEKETKPGADAASQETKPAVDTASQGTDSAESKGKEDTAIRETISDSGKSLQSETSSAVEIMVPIYNYDVVNIVVPAKYAVALNPYALAVKTGEDEFSTDQVISRKYGILNKSSTDKIVRITLEVEDLNGGKLVFVDSPEEAREADEDTYAVYLAAVPADNTGIRINGENADCDTTAAELSDVEMNGAMDSALALKEGKNTLAFKLSKAVYDFEEGSELILDDDDWIVDEDDEWLLDDDKEEQILDEDESGAGILRLMDLAEGEGGITAFTFTGVMNPKADWGKLLYGIKISAVYTYETATGEEVIVEGTGALIEP